MKKLILLLLTIVVICQCASAQSRSVEGVVVYAGDNEPLIGATVLPVGGGYGVATDVNGYFKLNVPRNVTQITVSYVGMISQTVAITEGLMRIALDNSENELDEVMVVAYGTAKRSAYTGSASLVKADDIEARLITNVTSALSGTVSGVQTLSGNGQPGIAPTIRIRGVGSINAGMAPLYIVDGVPYDGDIATINPLDVESMTVLKDAASAALYGSRGANGVILITTKKGKTGDATVSFDARWGANSRQITNYDLISSPAQYMELAYRAKYNAGYYYGNYSDEKAHAYANSQLNNAFGRGFSVYTVPSGETLIGVDGKINPNATLGYSNGNYYWIPDKWEDGTFRNGFRQEYNASVSGGGDNFNYYVSVGYLQDEGVIKNSDFDRLSTRATVDYQAKDWLKIGTNLTYTNQSSDYPDDQTATASSANAFMIANSIAPIYPMFIRDAEGNLLKDDNTGYYLYDYGNNDAGYTRNWMSMSNPAGDLLYNAETYLTDVFNGKWYATLTPIDGLSVTGTVGLFVDNTRYNYSGNKYYGQSASYGGSAQQRSSRTRGLNLQALANYKKTFAYVHNADLMFGYESYEWNSESHYGYGTYLYRDGDYTLGNVINGIQAKGQVDNYATRGIFARANYDYDSKYFGSVSYRRDASSRFHPDKRWGNFWSVSGAWEMAKERFMEDYDWIDMLKLKMSFGQQGNDAIGNYYAYVDQYSITGANSIWSDATLTYKGNPELTWETSNSFNTGIDFSLWKGKLSGTLEYFSRQTSDMLYYKPMSPSNGYTELPMNVGSMRNNGVEVELIYHPIDTRDFTWNVNMNATFINNKILKLHPDLNGELIDGNRIYREGESMYQYYFTKYAGVNQTNWEPLYWAIGDDGDEYATSDYEMAYATNRQATGDLLPTVYGGFGTSLKAYGFDFSIQFGYQLGGKIWDYGYQLFMHGGGTYDLGSNWHTDILDAWTPENINTNVPRLNSLDDYTNATSDRWITSSDYLSLNNITIGYTLPQILTRRLQLESVRIYASADNVALWSARKGLDPRQSYTYATTSVYTAIRCISGGIKITF